MLVLLLASVVTACLISPSHSTIGAQADAPPTPSTTCQLPPYNVEDLTNRTFWFANISSTSTQSICFGDNITSCSLYFAFCQPLSNLPIRANNCSDSAVCQVVVGAKRRQFDYSMGQFQANGTIFYEVNGTINGGFFVEVEDGSKTPTCNGTAVSTRVVLECNSSAQWTSQNLTDFIKVQYDDPTNCMYLITLQYDGACLAKNTTTTSTTSSAPATPTPAPTSSTSMLPSSSTTNSTTATPSPTSTPSNSSTPSSTSTPTSGSTSPTTSSSSNATTAVPTTNTGTATAPSVTVTSHSPSSESVTTTSTSSPSSGTRTSTSRPGPTPTTPPSPPPPGTTTKKPNNPPTADPDLHKISGLTAGVVIFALLAFFLLLALIGVVWYFKRGSIRYSKVKNEDM